MNIYSIYKATCLVNNKIYIGFTSNFEVRKQKHLNSILPYKFHRAIRKYGTKNFIWDILYQSNDLEYTLNIMEPLYILIYDSFLNGYNMTCGGGSTTYITEATREKIRNSRLGTKATKETKIKMINSQKNRKPISEETRNKLSKENNGNAKFFKFISPNGEEFIIKGRFQEFCSNHNLSYSMMKKIYRTGNTAKKGNCEGWLVYENSI